jgi:lipopolysaccharide transport system permease protein
MTAPQKTVIEAGRSDRRYWRDLWRFRELWLILTIRDVTVRYKQTVVGVSWAVLRPLLTMGVLVLVFGKVARLPSDGVPYPLLVLSGMLAWQLFAAAFGSASGSLVGNANLISKVYFPRLIVPLSAIGVAVVDFLVTLPLLVAVLLWYQYPLSWNVLALPLFALLALLAAIAAGLWVSALNVRFRDAGILVGFALQFGMYLSPVAYGVTAVPAEYRDWYSLNPLVGIIEGFRWCLLGGSAGLTPLSLGVSVGVTAVTLYTGYRYFRRTERTFADVI